MGARCVAYSGILLTDIVSYCLFIEDIRTIFKRFSGEKRIKKGKTLFLFEW